MFLRNFPSFLEGLSLRLIHCTVHPCVSDKFPFLFGGAFIEALDDCIECKGLCGNFPSFLEGLSLRRLRFRKWQVYRTRRFPFLFGGAFIEAGTAPACSASEYAFPFLFGGAFIEAPTGTDPAVGSGGNFPSFLEGLSLRPDKLSTCSGIVSFISLPFWRGFH